MNTNKFFVWRGRIGIIILAPAGILGLFCNHAIIEGTYWNLFFDVLGWLFFSCGIILRLWAMLYIGGRKDDCIVSEGPYSIFRNPVYLGSFCLMVSVGFFLKSLMILIAMAIMVVIYASRIISTEEEFLSQKFGEIYRQYCVRTPRFLPRFKNFHSPERIEVNLKALYKEVKKIIPWIALPIFTEVLAYLRIQPWYPHFSWLP
jgi:protein-S-isoprenylcysteine O-methyltransferase Ste14